ncbi:murein DD-endopeptidase MepM/ murein hydrolase activator NlpD [Microbacterium sp. AK009]|uniref:M23 family metallopeptidase n=1 Tax=Microbacterium sp. AK009 TaxID=2723068 RepID=UPI0015C78F36|nr:M23 family metallopeptidase [Microbacterium sp. AK009]NYF18016.1 murein DD-endopeptidase MepM/ murein hydrolase activator NlpD [Microbacterium sp. AK009]
MVEAIQLAYPFRGAWRVQNSPADRVPSHGTRAFASSFAYDFVPVDDRGRSAPFTLRSLFRDEPAEAFPGFGRPILAPVAGTVVSVHDDEPDHPAYRGFRSIGYAMTQRRRVAGGWRGLAGNHLMIRTSDAVIALCHLRAASIVVAAGSEVSAGDTVAGCGNSGNSTEPHLHIQAMDDPDPERARPLPIRFAWSMPRTGEIVRAGE